MQGRSVVLGFCPSPYCHYLNRYMFYLNANISLKVICWTRHWVDGQSSDYMLPPLSEHKNVASAKVPLTNCVQSMINGKFTNRSANEDHG